MRKRRAKVLPRPKAFRKLPPEQVAGSAGHRQPAGTCTPCRNAAWTSTGQIPVWRWNGQPLVAALQPAAVQGSFLPVDADFGPDGRFYLLERDLTLLGFRSRLRRWDITAVGSRKMNETVLLQTGSRHPRQPRGPVYLGGRNRPELRATMVSDDNFLPHAAHRTGGIRPAPVTHLRPRRASGARPNREGGISWNAPGAGGSFPEA